MRTLPIAAFTGSGIKRCHKYGAVQTQVDGIKFPSKAEARRCSQLKLLERAGEIRGLQIHPKFPIEVADGDIEFREVR
jgi:hypothetical protein